MINYIKGDATKPMGSGNKVLAHCCNNVNKWGRGFVVSLSAAWKAPEKAYRSWGANGYYGEDGIKVPFQLGEVQFVKVEADLHVCNMIGQHDIYTQNGIPPIRYDAIRKCLQKVNEFAVRNNATIHCPRFGAKLARGKWAEIEKIIKETISVDVYVYDL